MIRDFQESLRNFANDNADVVSPVEHTIDQLQALLEQLAPVLQVGAMTPQGAARVEFVKQACANLDGCISGLSGALLSGANMYRLAARSPKVDLVKPATVRKLPVAKRDD